MRQHAMVHVGAIPKVNRCFHGVGAGAGAGNIAGRLPAAGGMCEKI
jgi:hypothetical protein